MRQFLKFCLIASVLLVGGIIGVVGQDTSNAGDPDIDIYGREIIASSTSTARTRLLDQFRFPHRHVVEFRLLDDRDQSIGIFESSVTGVQWITQVRELVGASPSTIWAALNTDGREIPHELVRLYGPPNTDLGTGWLGNIWLTGVPDPSNGGSSGVCDNNWFGSLVGTEAAFPDAVDHYLVLDRWGDSSGSKGGYYQYAGMVDIWHGGICLQQEVQVEQNAPPGTAWYLWYVYEGATNQSLVTPVYAPRPGEAGHWIWYRCGSCASRYWVQVAAPNDGLHIQFDMGMDWRFD